MFPNKNSNSSYRPFTQVLTDGTNTYLYGRDRIGEQGEEMWTYHLNDALGSLRQITGAEADVLFAQSYEPYGKVYESSGTGTSNYGFSGELTDPSQLVYLRARYYQPSTGRFISRDTWGGNVYNPQSLNRWSYAAANPVMFVDPSGRKFLSADDHDSFYREPDRSLIIIESEKGHDFSEDEEAALLEGAAATASALAKTLNQIILEENMKNNNLFETGITESYAPLAYVTDRQAFYIVFKQPTVTFKNSTCSDHNPFICNSWGQYIDLDDIFIYKNDIGLEPAGGFRHETKAWIVDSTDETNPIKKYFLSISDSPPFLTHELGHMYDDVFDSRGRNAISLGDEAIYSAIGFYQRDFTNPDEWEYNQRSSDKVEEIFADMFVGWVYGKWDDFDVDSAEGLAAIAKSQFMDNFMKETLSELYFGR